MLIQVTLSYLCAGVVVENNRIVRAAPMLAWSQGQPLRYLTVWVERRRGQILVVQG